MIQYITKILIYSIVIYVYLNYNKKFSSICLSRKNKNDITEFLAYSRILSNLNNENLLSHQNNYAKIKNYNKIIKKNNHNGKNTVQKIGKTVNDGYNKYIKEKMAKEGMVKCMHVQPDLVKPNINDAFEMKLHEYQDKKYVLKESKISTRHKNSKPEMYSLKKQSQVTLSNKYTKDNTLVVCNDYNLTKLISQHLLNGKNNVLKNEVIEEIKSYILKYKKNFNEYTDLEKLGILKVILNNSQYNNITPDEINIMLYYALFERPIVHRNIPYYHDMISKNRNKLNQTNIRKETTSKQNIVRKNKTLLQPNPKRQKLPHNIAVDTNNLTNKIWRDRQNLPYNILVNKNNFMNTNLVEKKNSTQKHVVGKKKIDGNSYTTIKNHLENKNELFSNYDLIKKQNIIKIKDGSNKVHNPIEKHTNKENQITNEYKHSISTGSKQCELKVVNEVRYLFGNIKNDSSTKQKRMTEIYMENKKEEQQQSKKKEKVIEIYMENKNNKLENKIEFTKISDTNIKYDLSNKGDLENPNNIKLEMNTSNDIENDDELLERTKQRLTQLYINDKKDIIRPQRESVKVLELSPINKKKKSNNKNLDGNDFIDLFDNYDEQSLLTEVEDDKKIDVSIMDEIYAETERQLFEQIIGAKMMKGKYYKVKKYLKIFGLYVLPIILAIASISFLGLHISSVMASDIFNDSVIEAGKTAIVEGAQCLSNAATDTMQGIATDVLPDISLSEFSFDSLIGSFFGAIKNTAIVGINTASNTISCISDSVIPKAIGAAKVYGISVAVSQVMYPVGIAINIAIIIYIITKIIVKLNDMGKFNKFHKYRKKVVNKLKRKINTKKKGKKNQ
ncbi:Plasmodium exported protein, unknown function [Plasmodium berghei]|uniref:Uncharacterized protein n=1 Tax=Plasmodium berghei TaxID=5821 RepID=A0A1C6W986_PLABE|nr:Plasmodium exported protein, unknown function [Plasmodium berghei]